jgi:hypothetical protein
MSRKLVMGKIRAMAASLVLASAAISSSAAATEYWESPTCWYDVEAACTAEWQAWGYRSYDDCARLEPCYVCLYGYLCGYDDRWDYTRVEPDTGKPW